MYKHLFKIFNTGLAVAIILLTINSCSDAWESHYNTDTSATSDQTLWEQIKSHDNLSNFGEILEKTYVYSNNKMSAVSYAELLNSDQSFTVWAPVNGSFNKDSLLALCNTVAGELSVEKSFVRNHMARYLFSVSSTTYKEVILMNRKEKNLKGLTFGNIIISDPNIISSNGILHILSGDIPYFPNIYEGLCNDPDTKMFGSFLKSYQKDSLDELTSVASGIVDGKTVYVDSVLIEKNSLLTELGLLNSEDSSYLMIAPTDKAWDEAYKKISAYYNYSYIDQADSLQKYWAKHALVNDLFFNANLQPSVNDSLISTKYSSLDPKYHVFYKPFASGGILSEVKSKTKCSNGYIYKVDKWPFTLKETFFQPVKVEAEIESNILDYTLSTLNLRSVSGDSISKNGYIDVVPSKSSSNPTITFQVKNTLSGKYDVCVVCAPQTVYKTPTNSSDSADCFRPYKFRATIYYVDKTGASKNYNCGGLTYSNNPHVVDTVCVAKAFEFPACSYGRDEVTVSLKIQSYVLTRETATYNREMYIDCIYLRPHED
jgi:hypothetical protein